MAVRKNLSHDDRTREKIRTSQLVNRLQDFALSRNDPTSKKPVQMSRDQIAAALGLLAKTLPNLQSVEATVNGEILSRVVSAEPLNEDQWAARYGSGLATSAGASKSTH